MKSRGDSTQRIPWQAISGFGTFSAHFLSAPTMCSIADANRTRRKSPRNLWLDRLADDLVTNLSAEQVRRIRPGWGPTLESATLTCDRLNLDAQAVGPLFVLVGVVQINPASGAGVGARDGGDETKRQRDAGL